MLYCMLCIGAECLRATVIWFTFSAPVKFCELFIFDVYLTNKIIIIIIEIPGQVPDRPGSICVEIPGQVPTLDSGALLCNPRQSLHSALLSRVGTWPGMCLSFKRPVSKRYPTIFLFYKFCWDVKHHDTTICRTKVYFRNTIFASGNFEIGPGKLVVIKPWSNSGQATVVPAHYFSYTHACLTVTAPWAEHILQPGPYAMYYYIPLSHTELPIVSCLRIFLSDSAITTV